MSRLDYADLSELVGQTMASVTKKPDDPNDNDALLFVTADGTTYQLTHSQNCCESVYIDDICGDLDDLVGAPILMAEEVMLVNENPPGVPVPEYQDSWTWTFYKFATVKGYVTIRWYGDSNGYYSETADFQRVMP